MLLKIQNTEEQEQLRNKSHGHHCANNDGAISKASGLYERKKGDFTFPPRGHDGKWLLPADDKCSLFFHTHLVVAKFEFQKT